MALAQQVLEELGSELAPPDVGGCTGTQTQARGGLLTDRPIDRPLTKTQARVAAREARKAANRQAFKAGVRWQARDGERRPMTPAEIGALVAGYRKAVRRDPVGWAWEALHYRCWSKQAEILRALGPLDRQYVCVPSCNAAGKTHMVPVIALWFLNAYYPAQVVLTSSSWANIRRQDWPKFRALRESSTVRQEIVNGGRFLEGGAPEWTWGEHGVYTISPDHPESAGGYHAAGGILWIVDEASALDPRIERAIYGCLASGNGRIVLIGNPLVPDGAFYRACREAEAANNEGRWYRIKIAMTDCPAFTGAEPQIPGLATPDSLAMMREAYGEGSPDYSARVLAEFPSESQYALIPVAIVRAAVARASDDVGPMSLGVDVARFGRDSTVYTLVRGRQVLPQIVRHGDDLMATTGFIIQLMREHGIEPGRIRIDDCGVGGGVTDRLREQGLAVMAINVGASPGDKVRFANLRAEAAWGLRQWFEGGGCLPADDMLCGELGAVHLAPPLSDGRMRLEAKEDTKARLGRSPDRFDSLMLAVYQPAPAEMFRVRTVLPRERFGGIGDELP